MAPLPPMGKSRVLQWLAGRKGDALWFGSPHPCACVLAQDGVWRLRELATDPQVLRRASDDALGSGGSFMPEHAAALQTPTGRVHLEAPTRQALAALLEDFAWPRHW